MRGVAKVMDKDVDYFVAWVREDNEGLPIMSFEEAREVYKYRVFRDDYVSHKAVPTTEPMTYLEAKRKLEEIVLLTRGSNHE